MLFWIFMVDVFNVCFIKLVSSDFKIDFCVFVVEVNKVVVNRVVVISEVFIIFFDLNYCNSILLLFWFNYCESCVILKINCKVLKNR